jgi:GntR family transcriptional regulator, rspAB operon transcriptional repressor
MTRDIYKSMVQRIVMGEFATQEMLTDVGLARLFGTSRTPVREVCIRLVDEGFLRKARGRGYLITESSVSDLHELYQVRLLLEPTAAELAAGSHLPKDFFITCSSLIEQMEKYTNAVAGKTLSAEQIRATFLKHGEAECNFHDTIAKASRHKRLAKIICDLINQFRRFVTVAGPRASASDLERVVGEHKGILEAIRCHDTTEARRLMHEHLRLGSQGMWQLVTEPFAFQEPKSEGT